MGTIDIDRRLWDWLLADDKGISSQTIAAVMAKESQILVTNYGADIPYDPEDFGRCYRLLLIFPEWKNQLQRVADAYPIWQPFVDNWEKMTKMYEEELPTGKAPKLYDFMHDLRMERYNKKTGK